MIQLTQRAADHVQQMLQQRGYGMGLRLSVRQSGCSGFAYQVDYADQLNTDDVVFESHNIRLVIDKNSLSAIDGSEVDYQTSNVVNQGFEFHNPNVQDVCGCGESFNV